MEIAEHGIGLPTTNKLNDVGVDASHKHSRGATGAKGPRLNIGRTDVEGVCAEYCDGLSEGVAHICRNDVSDAIAMLLGTQRRCTG